MTALVGLYSPFPRSGKSTFAKALAETVEPRCILKFADGMRDIVAGALSDFFDGGEAELRSWFEDDRKDTADIPGFPGVTLRRCLQMVGQWGRSCIHPDIWVKQLEMRMRRKHNHQLVIVDDMRFENEYAMLATHDAVFVRLDRPERPYSVPHESNGRLEQLPFDYHITNDDTAQALRLKALAVAWDMGIA